MLTERDRKVIIAVGRHRVLSTQQIQMLYFPSYSTVQRRLRRELAGNQLSQPFYLNNVPLYRLTTQGKKMYSEMTGEGYRQPQWKIKYLPHLIMTNDVLIKLNLQPFMLEHNLGSITADAYIPKKNLCLEIDRGTESKGTVHDKFKAYDVIDNTVIWITTRPLMLNKWYNQTKCSKEIIICSHGKLAQLKEKMQ